MIKLVPNFGLFSTILLVFACILIANSAIINIDEDNSTLTLLQFVKLVQNVEYVLTEQVSLLVSNFNISKIQHISTCQSSNGTNVGFSGIAEVIISTTYNYTVKFCALSAEEIVFSDVNLVQSDLLAQNYTLLPGYPTTFNQISTISSVSCQIHYVQGFRALQTLSGWNFNQYGTTCGSGNHLLQYKYFS